MQFNLNNIRLGLNLFATPVFLLICGLVAGAYAQSITVSPYLQALTTFVDWLVDGVLLVGIGWFLISCWRLWGAYRGVGENCHSCGMPTRYMDKGRYGPYYKCMACGVNRKAYF